MEFRKASPKDAEIIIELLVSVALNEGRPATSVKISAENLSQVLKCKEYVFGFVAELESQIVGAALCCERFSPYSGGTNLFLIDFGFFPDHRGKGYGTFFFEYLKSFATRENYTKVEWFVHKHNSSAKKFYARQSGAFDEETEHWEYLCS